MDPNLRRVIEGVAPSRRRHEINVEAQRIPGTLIGVLELRSHGDDRAGESEVVREVLIALAPLEASG